MHLLHENTANFTNKNLQLSCTSVVIVTCMAIGTGLKKLINFGLVVKLNKLHHVILPPLGCERVAWLAQPKMKQWSTRLRLGRVS